MDDQTQVLAWEAEFVTVNNRARALAGELSPVTPAMVAAAPTWRAAYSDRTCALMASLCAIAYDSFEDPTGVGLGTMRYRLAKGGFKLINVYNTSIGTQAYLAVSDQMAVLAFRGTQDQADWVTNLGAAFTPINQNVGAVEVHRGFLGAFQAVEAGIRKDLEAHVPNTLGLYITGHSLGGALAQLASATFERDTLAACYTFGSPRVGRRPFDAEVKCAHYRMVNAKDVVPSVPPPFLGFAHGGDVRVLGRMGDRPKRYDRLPLSLLLRFFVFGVGWFFTRKFPLIDDHMIGRYREKLIAAANLRAPGWKDEDQPALMDEAEITTRLQIAFLKAALRTGRSLSEGNDHDLLRRARTAAASITAATPTPGGRAALTVQAEAAFERLVAEMAVVAKELPNYPPNLMGERTLAEALRRLCPLPPIC